MALPLPKVVYDVEPGGGIVTSMKGQNALQESMLNNKIKQSQAQYAPYMNYADALSKIAYSKYLPFQIQATAMTNPALLLAAKDNPAAFKEMYGNFVNQFNEAQKGLNNLNGIVPAPSQMNPSNNIIGSFLNWLSGKNGGQNAPANPMANLPAGGGGGANAMIQPPQVNAPMGGPNAGPPAAPPQSPLLPSPGPQALADVGTAKYQGETQKPGTTFRSNQNDIISSPTETTRTTAQTTISGIQNAIPLLNNIAKGGEEFLSSAGKGKLLGSQAIGLLNQYTGAEIPQQVLKFFGLNRDMISRYGQWRADIEKAPESLIKALQLPQDQLALHKLATIVEPLAGETPQGYRDRVLREASDLKNQRLPQAQGVLGQGYNVNAQPQQQPAFKMPKFKGPKEFKAWFIKQSPDIQQLVRQQLGGK